MASDEAEEQPGWAGKLSAGRTLRTLLTSNLDQRRALAIMRQVLDALAVAHEAGAIHGDIKPENIVVATDGYTERVKLADFGAATLVDAAKPRDPRYTA